VSAEVRLRPDVSGVEIAPASGSAGELARQLRAGHEGLVVRARGAVIDVSFADAGVLLEDSATALRWAPDAERAVRNRLELRRRAPAVLAEARRMRDSDPEGLRRMLGTRPILDVLDDHQILNVALMTSEDGWGSCVFDEQGTGKTPTVIAAFDVLAERNDAEVLVVVAPKSMVGEWAEEFRRFTGDLYHVVVLEGSRLQRARVLASGADVVVVNYEGAVVMLDDLRLLATRSRVVLAVDESFNVKNPDATRTAAVATLREYCSRCFVLCGTPAPNTARDIVSQVSLVDLGLTFDDVSLEHLEQEQERVTIQDALTRRAVYSRNLKGTVLPDLPSRRFSEVRVEFAGEQRRLYEQALDGLLEDLHEVDEAEFEQRRLGFGQRRSALLRLCSHPAALVVGYTESPAKITALDTLLRNRAARGEKIVLWSFYRYSLDALAVRYADLGLVRIDGSVGDVASRRDAVRRFQHDDETMIFLGNPAAAGSGLTLHRAALAVYESFSNQAAHFMQSLDRIHRRGQRHPVEYVVLLCDGSLEELEYERILAKVDRQAELLGDPEPHRVTRSLMLEEMTEARDRLRP
jgi:SNF2 family DNA or RNA helicase